ncbi:semaphorin-7A-like [Amblyraja radiata]|uniref:semaphorin-7A-like n=1 Tax=Amblyraja radiata TaxID=386614 RepID=UPI001401E176|nr:semaphorin-7A-like [Amblyraja radiata]
MLKPRLLFVVQQLLLLLLLGAAERLPRLKITPTDEPRVQFAAPAAAWVGHHDPSSDTLYVGATGGVWLLRFSGRNVSRTQIPLPLEESVRQRCQSERPGSQELCKNVVTVIERFNRSTIMVCGTHAGSPKCWFLAVNGTQLARDHEGRELVKDGREISPSTPIQRPVTITVDEAVYSAIPSSSQSSGSIELSYGRPKRLKTGDRWMQSPTFVGAAWMQMKDSSKDEVYFFFRESNESSALDGEPYRAYIGRVCKVDEGVLKAATQEPFSTFLKARMICGFPAESRLFNKIEDAFLLSVEDDPRSSVVYGIFSSLWNSTAVCAYSQADIERAFRNSRLKGLTANVIGSHRPGMCVKGNVPRNVLTNIRNFPEIEDPIYPIKRHPLYVMKHNNYTRVTADRVRGANQQIYHVLFLGTGNGKIHKVLHYNGKSFIISELSPFKSQAPVSTIMLDSSTGHLFVATPMEAARLSLAGCAEYGHTCPRCVAARDPYCGWDRATHKCVALPQTLNTTDSDILQNVEQLNVSICDSDDVLSGGEVTQLMVSAGAYLYLPCPVTSYHAAYSWKHEERDGIPCTVKDGSCPLMFDGHMPVSDGSFTCFATEDGLEERVATYFVRLNSGSRPGQGGTTLALALGMAALCSML